MVTIKKGVMPPIKYFGGKNGMKKVIYEYFPPNDSYDTYIEPFGGSYGVGIGMENLPKVEIYNDLNKNVYSLYKVINDNDLFEKELNESKVYKIMVFIGLRKNKMAISKETNKVLREEFDEIESSWTAQVNELTPKGCNKGNGVERYCKLMNINKEDVYVVGDSGNDITMFNKFYENSYCMKHGHPSARKYAKHIISRVYKLEKLIMRGENHE